MPIKKKPAGWSSSGGKDSMLAPIAARKVGIDVRAMVSMCDETGLRNRSHGIPRTILAAQAERLGLELIAPAASWADYESHFVAALQDLQTRGFGEIVFDSPLMRGPLAISVGFQNLRESAAIWLAALPICRLGDDRRVVDGDCGSPRIRRARPPWIWLANRWRLAVKKHWTGRNQRLTPSAIPVPPAIRCVSPRCESPARAPSAQPR